MKNALLALVFVVVGCGTVEDAPDGAGGASAAAGAAGAAGAAAGVGGAAGAAGGPGGAAGAAGAPGPALCDWPAVDGQVCRTVRPCTGAPACALCWVLVTQAEVLKPEASVSMCTEAGGRRCVSQCGECTGGENPKGPIACDATP